MADSPRRALSADRTNPLSEDRFDMYGHRHTKLAGRTRDGHGRA
jgi:hypothetical protein